MKGKFAAAFALLACFGSGQAQAVMLNPKGLGQVLIYPYYTVNKGQDTYVSVANGSDVGKLVKVRYLEGYNGRTVLDFNLYLGPFDAWSAAITADDVNGPARLVTADRSCTDPLLNSPVAFKTVDFDGSVPGSPADGGPTGATRTREGHVEIIAIGDIIPESATDKASRVGPDASGQLRARCDQLPTDVAADLVAPTGSLFGSGAVIDVGNGMYYPYNAEALSGFTDRVLLTNLAMAGGPTLQDANSAASGSGGALATVFTDDGNSLTLDYARGIDAVSAVFMASTLYNEFLITPELGANTDWVLTFPTKRFYVDKQRYPSQSTAPFEKPFAAGKSEAWMLRTTLTNREGMSIIPRCPPVDDCLQPHTSLQLLHEVNVVAFPRDASNPPASSLVLGSRLLPAFAPVTYQATLPGSGAGWMRLEFAAPNVTSSLDRHVHVAGTRGSGEPVKLLGLPATGFMVYNIINAQAQPGKLANYGGAFPHRMQLACLAHMGPAVGVPAPSCSPP